MSFWNSLAFVLWFSRCWQFDLWFSAFSKTSLNMLKFTVHILLNPGLENFEHYFTSVWDECNCAVVWAFLALPFFGIGMKTDLFQSCGHCWVFQICWHIECSTFTASSFMIWNSSTGIPSPPLALFIVMLPKTHLSTWYIPINTSTLNYPQKILTIPVVFHLYIYALTIISTLP